MGDVKGRSWQNSSLCKLPQTYALNVRPSVQAKRNRVQAKPLCGQQTRP